MHEMGLKNESIYKIALGEYLNLRIHLIYQDSGRLMSGRLHTTLFLDEKCQKYGLHVTRYFIRNIYMLVVAFVLIHF